MGSIGANQGNNTTSTNRREEAVKGLIFGTAIITDNYVDIDGYSNKKSEAAMLRELAKVVRPYSEAEADNLNDIVRFNEMNQIPYDGGSYILEWEPVNGSAGRFNENEEYEQKDANWYVHIRFGK